MKEPDFSVEIHLLGGIGHKVLIKKLKNSAFKDNSPFWIGPYCTIKDIIVEGKDVRLKLSDANYSEEPWEKDCNLAVVFIGDTNSFNDIKTIYNNNKKYCSNAVKYIRVYNNEDDIDEQTKKKFEEFSKNIEASFEIEEIEDNLISDNFLKEIIEEVRKQKEIENVEKENSCCIIS